MKACMLIWDYWPGLEGGSERQCRKMAHLLAARGIACEVYTARTSRAMPAREDDNGVAVTRCGLLCPFVAVLGRWIGLWSGKLFGGGDTDPALRRQRAVTFWLMLPWVWLARLSFLAEAGIRIGHRAETGTLFHLHEPSWLGGFGVCLARRTGGAAICQEATFPVLQRLGYDVPLRGFWDRLRRRAYYIAMAPHFREALLDEGIPAERIFLLPNGVSLSPTVAVGGSGNGEVLYVGNLSQGAHWKAFDILIQAWAVVSRQIPGAHLTLVGGGDPAPWEALAARLGCRGSLSFAGRTERPEDFYRRAAAFVLPSRVEGMSNALLEAQSWGLPCVVSDIPGNTAVVSDGVNGLVVPAGDAPALAGALVRLLGDPTLCTRLGAAARRRAEKEYDEERVVSRLIGIYREVVAHTRGPGRISGGFERAHRAGNGGVA